LSQNQAKQGMLRIAKASFKLIQDQAGVVCCPEGWI
jgi:hypothetical protein